MRIWGRSPLGRRGQKGCYASETLITENDAPGRELRREPTLAEAKLWKYLRSQNLDGTHFRRQYAIGNYIVDFCAPRARLIIEVDGSQHLDQKDYDMERTEFLKAKGYRVLRFWNNDILSNIQDVMAAILQAISNKQITDVSGEGK